MDNAVEQQTLLSRVESVRTINQFKTASHRSDQLVKEEVVAMQPLVTKEASIMPITQGQTDALFISGYLVFLFTLFTERNIEPKTKFEKSEQEFRINEAIILSTLGAVRLVGCVDHQYSVMDYCSNFMGAADSAAVLLGMLGFGLEGINQMAFDWENYKDQELTLSKVSTRNSILNQNESITTAEQLKLALQTLIDNQLELRMAFNDARNLYANIQNEYKTLLDDIKDKTGELEAGDLDLARYEQLKAIDLLNTKSIFADLQQKKLYFHDWVLTCNAFYFAGLTVGLGMHLIGMLTSAGYLTPIGLSLVVGSTVLHYTKNFWLSYQEYIAVNERCDKKIALLDTLPENTEGCLEQINVDLIKLGMPPLKVGDDIKAYKSQQMNAINFERNQSLRKFKLQTARFSLMMTAIAFFMMPLNPLLGLLLFVTGVGLYQKLANDYQAENTLDANRLAVSQWPLVKESESKRNSNVSGDLNNQENAEPIQLGK